MNATRSAVLSVCCLCAKALFAVYAVSSPGTNDRALWAQQFAAPEMLPQGGASSPPRSTAAPETRRGAASGGDDDSSSGAGSWEERPGLLQARADGARRGALSGGGVRHMLMQISPLGDLVRQVIWGLCRAASRGAPGRRTSGAKSKYSEIPPAFV